MKKGRIWIALAVMLLSIVSAAVFIQAKRTHADPPDEHRYMVTVKDQNRALRIFGPGLHIENSVLTEKKLQDISYYLQLPYDGTGYVSEKETWEKFEISAAYTDETTSLLSVFFQKNDPRIKEYKAVFAGETVEKTDIQGKQVDYTIHDYPGNISCPSDIYCTFEEDGKTCFLSYTFPFTKKTVSQETRTKMIEEALQNIRFLLSD